MPSVLVCLAFAFKKQAVHAKCFIMMLVQMNYNDVRTDELCRKLIPHFSW